MDKVTLDRIDLLHPKVRGEVKGMYLDKIVPALTGRALCRFAYTLRTFAEQDAIYAQGRTKLFDANGNRLGKVSNAKGGQSYHNYGLAIDIVLIDGKSASYQTNIDFDKDGKADWMEIVDIFKAYGWAWGGDWKKFPDKPHFEKTFGYTTQQLLAKYNAKDFIVGTNYVKI